MIDPDTLAGTLGLLLQSLAQLGGTGVLAFFCWQFWTSLRAKDAEHFKALEVLRDECRVCRQERDKATSETIGTLTSIIQTAMDRKLAKQQS